MLTIRVDFSNCQSATQSNNILQSFRIEPRAHIYLFSRLLLNPTTAKIHKQMELSEYRTHFFVVHVRLFHLLISVKPAAIL